MYAWSIRLPWLWSKQRVASCSMSSSTLKSQVCVDWYDAIKLDDTPGASRVTRSCILMHRAGKALLEKGQLRKRATFLPLNKIQGKSIPRDVVARAQELAGKENAVPAIELVEYAPELQAVCVCSPGY